MKSPAISMDNKTLFKKIFMISLPLMFSNLFQQFYNIADAVIVGNFIGKEALGAVGSCGSLSLILIYFFVGLSTGASVCASHAYGGKNPEQMQRYVNTTMAMSMVAGIVLTIIGVVFCPVFFSWMNLDAAIMEEAVAYGRVYFLSMIPMFVYNMGSAIIRATGKTKVIMYSLITACLGNILLDLLFVGVFRWGVGSAAFATVLAQCLSAAVVLVDMLRTKDIYRLTLKNIGFRKRELKEIIKIGAPAGLQSVVQSFSNLCFHANINTYGSDATAALTSFNRLDSFIYLPGDSIALGASVVTGHSIGGKQPQKVKRIFRMSAVMAIAVTGFICLLLLLFKIPILSLFSRDAAVLAYGIDMINFMVPLYVFYVLNQIFAGVIRGTGEAKIPMVIVLIFTCGFRVIWNLIVPHLTTEIEAIYLCYPLSWMITFAVYALYYRKGQWLKKHMKKGDMVNYAE